MTRRMHREGVADWQVNRAANQRYWDEQKRRGLKPYTPFTVSDGFTELSKAWWHRYYRLYVLRRLLSAWERKEHLRYARLYLTRTRTCDRPRLP